MGEYLNFLDVANVEEFVPRHEQPPIYIPCLRASLTNGHFITFLSSSETIVGQIIRKQDNCQDEIIVCCFLPLYDDSTRRHIIYPSILPQVISHASCLGVVELVNIGKIVRINIKKITGLAFVFHEDDVINDLYHIKGCCFWYTKKKTETRHGVCNKRKGCRKCFIQSRIFYFNVLPKDSRSFFQILGW